MGVFGILEHYRVVDEARATKSEESRLNNKIIINDLSLSDLLGRHAGKTQ